MVIFVPTIFQLIYLKRLNYMLRHKTEGALEMIHYFEEDQLVIPKYITEGIQWLAQS